MNWWNFSSRTDVHENALKRSLFVNRFRWRHVFLPRSQNGSTACALQLRLICRRKSKSWFTNSASDQYELV